VYILPDSSKVCLIDELTAFANTSVCNNGILPTAALILDSKPAIAVPVNLC
jgi:hypothetical protein